MNEQTKATVLEALHRQRGTLVNYYQPEAMRRLDAAIKEIEAVSTMPVEARYALVTWLDGTPRLVELDCRGAMTKVRPDATECLTFLETPPARIHGGGENE